MNKMLFCDCLDKLILFFLLLFQVVTNVRTIMLCIIVPKQLNFSVKMNYCDFLGGAGSVTYLTDDSLSYHL